MFDSGYKTGWIGPALPGRDCEGTYCETPLQKLPAVEAADDLAWLAPLDPRIDSEMRQFHPDAQARREYAVNAEAIVAQAAELGLQLPRAFTILIRSEALQDRFPSATACYFDLPGKIGRAPAGLDGFVIRFLNDQQCCVLWYLHLPTQGAARVLAFLPFEGADYLEDLYSGNDGLSPEADDAVRVVSRSFTEFLYRYWIENSILMKQYRKIELTTAEIDYIGGAKR